MSQRLRLHYVDWGNRDAPPLILVHGGRDHCRSWDWTAERLRADWHVIAPDLRGHGDSAWSLGGDYTPSAFVYDLAQLIHQLGFQKVTLVAHSLGGNIALRYTGLFPEKVHRLVAIEGLGPSPRMIQERLETPIQTRLRDWIERKRAAAGRLPRRYTTVEEALEQMREANPNLSGEQARHLTLHGISQNEDGTFTWKFDNYIRTFPPVDLAPSEVHALWNAITCPTLLLYGAQSWASDPVADGRAAHFRNAEVKTYPDAGHWLHHDQFEMFMADLERFLTPPSEDEGT